jgi:hypothetical protein
MSEQNHPDNHVPLDEAWADVPADETIADDAVPLCPDCWTANDPANHFCEQCGAPLTSHASIDPLGRVYAAGHVYRKTVDRPPSRFAVVGMWILFLPGILLVWWPFVLTDSSTSIYSEFGVANIVGLALAAGVACLYVCILWRVTSRYLRREREPSSASE